MSDLKTDYKDDVLDVSANVKRIFNLVDQDGKIVVANVSIQDITKYTQEGDSFGAADINATNEAVNGKLDGSSTVDPMLATEEGFAADAYQTKLQFEEQNKNISEQQIVLDNYSDRLASIESIMGSYVESTSGSFVISGLQANGGTTERIITFSNPLFKVPTVTTSTTDPAASLTVSNVSQSGFKIKIVNTYKYDAISTVISWIAVAK